MKIIIAGGSGYLGQAIIQKWSNPNDTFHILTTNQELSNIDNYYYWDGISLGDWADVLEGSDVLINLCGKSVNCRYTIANKAAILSSRTSSTRILGLAMSILSKQPGIWINASTATIYKDEYEQANTENEGIIGEGFSVEVAKMWEGEFFRHQQIGMRQVALRTGFVLGSKGELFNIFRKHTKMGLSGPHGSGKQMISWVHDVDFVRAIEFILARPQINGPINIVSPNAVSDTIFMKSFRDILKVYIGLPMPKWMLHIGAIICKSEVELLLKSRWVYPEKLTQEGFKFRFETIENCLFNLINSNKVEVELSCPMHL